MRKKLLQNILFAAMAAWVMYGTGLTTPLGFEQDVASGTVSALALR
ncbi:MAG: hypothetical protein RI907_3664 [Pseudomonadota bacterium]|jgi:hypothetical protein